ncbi:hypothetical protein WJX82_008141 [Trebouxia sp. C0006]
MIVRQRHVDLYGLLNESINAELVNGGGAGRDGAVSGLALAIMTDQAFILTYQMGDAKAALSEYFCSPHIHWQHWLGISKDLDSLDKLDCLWDLEDRDFQEPCTFSKWDQSVDLDFAGAFGDRELVQVTARTGLLHWLFDHPKYASYLLALGLTADNACGCLSNYLFQATPALQKQLPGNVLETLSINTVIGIQIRIPTHFWDAVWDPTCARQALMLGDGVIKAGMEANYDWDSVADPWFQCAQDLETSLNISMHLVRWLLVTDSSQFKAWAKGKLGGKLFTGSHGRVALFHEALRANSNSSVFTVQQDWNQWSKAWQGEMTPIHGIERTCHVHRPDRPLDVMRAWVGV